MKRVAKIGGKVAVIDPVKGGGQYFPDNRLNELYGKFITAFGTAIDKGWREKLDMSTYVDNYHFRIPELFLKARLADITMHGYLSTFLLCDIRRDTKEMHSYLQARLGLWKKLMKRNEKCASLGGMKKGEFRELSKRYSSYLENLIIHPRKIKTIPELHIVSRVIVCGTKNFNK